MWSCLPTGHYSDRQRLRKDQRWVKVRSLAFITTSECSGLIDVAEPLSEDIQLTLKLKNRAFKVFKTLFYTPSQPDLPGEIPWADFLCTIASTNFSPEKLYRSVWQFTPLKLDVKRGVQFHELHPIGKIPFRIARRMGAGGKELRSLYSSKAASGLYTRIARTRGRQTGGVKLGSANRTTSFIV